MIIDDLMRETDNRVVDLFTKDVIIATLVCFLSLKIFSTRAGSVGYLIQYTLH